ncbi:hypothetical protein NP493_640g00016 [Ridgeia piscesae]|uniref:Enoyl reductase (ER) domain-containing protein n=1 Tax=Ridgeia piscesae TaxID=27915 RepID=A0AAD9NQA6_RIDPI|nr:hypothetical protein NP493_640g00016 [Ridgeia piscesae]
MITLVTDEVLLAVQTVGICRTNVLLWKGRAMGSLQARTPDHIPGHECSACVAKLGPEVTCLRVGDRVAVEPGIACWKCSVCKTGRYNLCDNFRALSFTPGVEGTMQRYLVHPAELCHKLPEHVTYDDGAMVEPVAEALHTCLRAGITVESEVLILGADPVGLSSLLVAKAMCARHVCIADHNEERLAMAKVLGADYTVLVYRSDASVAAKQITETMACMPDITIESSASEAAIQIAMIVTKAGGVVMMHMLSKENTKLPLAQAALREIDVKGAFLYPGDRFPLALSMVSSGAIDFKQIITHRFPLDKAQEAFEVAGARKGGLVKVVIDCGTEPRRP